MTWATRRSGKLNFPVPMAGKATDVKLCAWTVWKQLVSSFLRTYKLNNSQDVSNLFYKLHQHSTFAAKTILSTESK